MKLKKFRKIKQNRKNNFKLALEKRSKLEEPLGSLYNAIERLIASKNSFEEQLKEQQNSSNKSVTSSNNGKSDKVIPIILNDKVDEFIKWYSDNMVKGNYTDIGEYCEPEEMRNFIEKMAVWYELRYPDYEINRIMPGSAQEQKNISEIMFHKNSYINGLFDENSYIHLLDWDEFYNTKSFINSLPSDEKWYFNNPKYPSTVYFQSNGYFAHFHLTSNGKIKMSKGIHFLKCRRGAILTDEELEGKHIKEAVCIMKDKGIIFPEESEMELAIKRYDNKVYQKEEMLNCVMYRIIERGGNRIGPRRAFLFAKEFGRNIDIPMIYGVDYSDPGLRRFINEYIKSGGSKDLICYVNYFSRAGKHEDLDTVSVQEMIKKVSNNAVTFYTLEEDKLHQELVNVLASQINYDVVKKEEKEEIKRLRIERKIEKSRKNKI